MTREECFKEANLIIENGKYHVVLRTEIDTPAHKTMMEWMNYMTPRINNVSSMPVSEYKIEVPIFFGAFPYEAYVNGRYYTWYFIVDRMPDHFNIGKIIS